MSSRLELIRAAFGISQLVAPALLVRRVLDTSVTGGVLVVARILGARHPAQALVTMPEGRHWLRPLGGAVDAVHALSMVGVALVHSDHRRVALTDAAVAGAFALLELRAGLSQSM